MAMPRLSANPETRSVQIGVLGTLLVHALLILIVPHIFRLEPGQMLAPAPQASQFDIELAPDEFPLQVPEKPPAPFKFVETNPDAPDNVPDKTDNFGAQNQQVAQEKPSEEESDTDRPAMEGKQDFESNQIVSGRLAPPSPPSPSAPPVEEAPTVVNEATPRAQQNPLSGFEKREGESEDNYGSNIAKFAENATPVPEKVDGMENVPLIQGATGTTPRIDPRRPRQDRPTIDRRARPAIFAENKLGTQNIGPVAVDVKWSNYGQYLQQLIETVQIQWDRILIQSRIYPSPGTTVSVKFRLNNKGQVTEIISVGPAGAPDQASRACVSAITERAPYGDWTDDMVSVLGEQQELTFTFYYQ